MKKLFTALSIYCLVFTQAYAQGPIPYGDFTNWVQDSLGNWDPEGWITTNSLYSSPTILQDTDRMNGAGYSVKFVSVLDAVSGDYENGLLTMENQPFSGSTRPATLRGFWKKVSSSNSNIFGIEIKMFNSSGIEIGDGSAHTPLTMSVPNWTAFTIPIDYTTNDPVSFYEIVIGAFNITGDPGMFCHLDDLSFDVSTGVSEVIQEELDCEIQFIDGKNAIALNKKEAGEVIVDVWDLKGQLKTTLIQSHYPSGESYIPLDFELASGGHYLCRVLTERRMKVFRACR